MIRRCTNPKAPDYKHYGGAGVKICKRWSGTRGFQNFLADKGKRPKGTTLGRFGDIGPYSPENTAWQTPTEHGAEQRKKRLPKKVLRKAA